MADPQSTALFDLGALFDDLGDVVPSLIEDIGDVASVFTAQVQAAQSSLTSRIFSFMGEVGNLSLPNLTLPSFSLPDFPALDFWNLGQSWVVDATEAVFDSIAEVTGFIQELTAQAETVLEALNGVSIPFLEDLVDDTADPIDQFLSDFGNLANRTVRDALGEGVNLITNQDLDLLFGDQILEVVETAEQITNGLLTSNLFEQLQTDFEERPTLRLTLSAAVEPSNGGDESRQLVATASVTPLDRLLNGEGFLGGVSFVL